MNIGKQIRAIRRGKMMSQVELCDAAGITQSALSQIESGKKRPGVETMKTLCEALNVSEGVLYVMSLEISDVPKHKRAMFEQSFSTAKDILLKICNIETRK